MRPILQIFETTWSKVEVARGDRQQPTAFGHKKMRDRGRSHDPSKGTCVVSRAGYTEELAFAAHALIPATLHAFAE